MYNFYKTAEFHYRMKTFIIKLVLLNIICIPVTKANNEILNLLKENDLSSDEMNIVEPLFEQLQLQYDYIVKLTGSTPERIAKKSEIINESYATILQEFQQYFDGFSLVNISAYDSQLPKLEDVLEVVNVTSLNKDQQLELLDMKSVLEDVVNETQNQIDELVKKSLLVESNLLQLNKPKLVALILKALKLLFGAASQLSRAAYCTYMHIPEFNTSLHYITEGLDCYTYISNKILAIQHETVQTIKILKRNLYELAEIYEKFESKETLLGKILTIVLNVINIGRSISDTFSAAMHALDGVQNYLPEAIQSAAQCGLKFATKIPFLKQTVTNVTACILYVDNTTADYNYPDIGYIENGDYYVSN